VSLEERGGECSIHVLPHFERADGGDVRAVSARDALRAVGTEFEQPVAASERPRAQPASPVPQ
jgi:hypothetical protein